MTLSQEALDRLADIVELQPTKNAALQERWGLDSGSEVHSYLESDLGEYYYRNEDSLICATPEAEALVTGEEVDDGRTRTVAGTALQRQVLDVLSAPNGEPQSVVTTLHDVQEATDADPTVDEVRSALHTLADKRLVERVRRSVPTFRLAIARKRIEIERR
ncbi:hypothetical protein BRC61_02170 [Halobacteriales archaeon QH_10_65_19]|nr:MAG: hypothetical protein BRC61_02170 [Halobacteriales archaeon QH_10_65_19]